MKYVKIIYYKLCWFNIDIIWYDFEVRRHVVVTDQGRPVQMINELETKICIS